MALADTATAPSWAEVPAGARAAARICSAFCMVAYGLPGTREVSILTSPPTA